MRSHGAENRKNRPEYYGKTACLASLIRAAQAVTPAPELVFVNDGALPAHMEQMMSSAGVVLQGEFGSNRRSYRRTLALAVRQAADPDDLVWFAEDDYLYTPDAFVHLVEAAADLPGADYFSMYLGELEPRELEAVDASPPRPARGAAVGPESLSWVPAVSTTSSFAVRSRLLLEDVALLRLMPFTGGAFDHSSFLALQRRYPFTLHELREDLMPYRSQQARDWPRFVLRGTVRTVVGARALRRPSRGRTLFCPTRDLIAHLEVGAYDPSEGWEQLASASSEWATQSSAQGESSTFLEYSRPSP